MPGDPIEMIPTIETDGLLVLRRSGSH
jgi:predicted RNA binding protein YcfA (HicA-like mRNA interferase family)